MKKITHKFIREYYCMKTLAEQDRNCDKQWCSCHGK